MYIVHIIIGDKYFEDSTRYGALVENYVYRVKVYLYVL